MQKNSDIRMVDKIEMVAISDLKPYENNARLNDNAVPALMESIKRFGFVVPIVITREKSIVCGHTRVKAASKLGMGQIPCVYADGLTEAEIKALRLADNKVSEIAMWDMEKLDAELASIGSEIDMSDFGFENLTIKQEETLKETQLKFNSYRIIIDCDDESDARCKFEQLTEEGFKCSLSTL